MSHKISVSFLSYLFPAQGVFIKQKKKSSKAFLFFCMKNAYQNKTEDMNNGLKFMVRRSGSFI